MLPGYDRLCREGMNFTSHFTSAVPCSPSRATLFTGLHVTQHGVQNNVNFGMNAPLDPDIPNMAHCLKAAGYRTPYFGKWHLTEMKVTSREKLDAYGFENWVPPDHHGTPYDGLMHDRMFATEAIHWLRGNGTKGPWFLTLSMVNPHDICFYPRLDVPAIAVPDVFSNLPGNHHDDLKNKPRIQTVYRDGYGRLMGTQADKPERLWLHYLDFYYWLQQRVDHQIARTLSTLDKLGLAQNTIVIFTSDHGDMCGSHKLQAKGPFMYQENNNVPLVVRWPARIQPGAQTSALTQSPDLFPTLLDMVGIRADTGYLPGKSLMPVISSPEKTDLNDHILMAFGMQGGGRLAQLGAKLGVNVKGVPVQLRAIHDGRHKFARYFDEGCEEEHELYDLENDPLELRNLAADPGYAKLAKEMAERLAEAEQKEMAAMPSELLRRKC